uniref:S phase cyclin A-associated protein in the endoplasmic reticulum N-terminal domain-containing protein n=1 Tax=Leersia perrieri TaxID=77586 RepID=A0A0D9X148_9ORYZ
MENDHGDIDDLGSGWFEVKKKHRSSSKFTLQRSSGGSNNKISNLSSQSHTNFSSDGARWCDRSECTPQITKINVGVDESGSRETMKVYDEECADVDANNLNNELSVSASEQSIKKPKELLVAEETSESPKVCKIECADSPTPHQSSNCSSGPAKSVDLCDHVKGPPMTDTVAVLSNTSVRFGDFDEVPGLALHADACRNNNSSPKHTQSDNATEFANECKDESELKTEMYSCKVVDVTSSVVIQGEEAPTEDKSKDLDICELTDSPLDVSGSPALADAVSLSCANNDLEVPVTSSSVASTESQTVLHAPTSADFGVETAGSKERFRQRLWCFLFENLNRAVDELYLLCELECDMEQINESVLVLEEAISDFQELKSRAEHFDNTKKSTALPKEGMPMTVKADHRRPHALSWEVRRMTSSPHRQEILSSSLEAFQRIQLELARKQAGITSESFASSSSGEVSGSSSKLTTASATVGSISLKVESQVKLSDTSEKKIAGERQSRDTFKSGRPLPQNMPSSSARSRKGSLEPIAEVEKHNLRKDRDLPENKFDRLRSTDTAKRTTVHLEKEKQNAAPRKSLDAWKEKRNWEDILKSPVRSSRVSHSPGVGRKVPEHARVLHDKLMSPEKKKRSALDMKREAEEKHARALRIRSQLESERVQRLQRTSEKLNRVNEWQAVRSSKLREVMNARHQRGESRHEAHLAQVAKRAGDESTKVNEVRFITSLNEENKKFLLRQKLHDSEMRRAEKLQVIKTKQKEDIAREEAVLERRKILEAEKMQRLAEIQRKKEEAIVRREEERKASSAAREARAAEQQRRKEIRAKAQQEEAELLAQKLAEKLRESEQRRKYYLEQIRERASMDFRDQPSPFQRRFPSKDNQNRSSSANSGEGSQVIGSANTAESGVKSSNSTQMKRRIKKIRQRLMALKHDFVEPLIGENTGIVHRAALGTAKSKLSRWLQDLQRLRQARKEGAASIGLIVGDMTKYLEGKDLELHASRQVGLLDFIASALPASHTSRPGACQVTVYLLRLLRVLLSLPANRTYFLVQNLLPPIIPMLSVSLENYIKVAASNSGSSNLQSSKTSTEYMESVGEVLDGFFWTVTVIVGHIYLNDQQLQMQGGLIELIVAYQIIHRLRDLFALYDRPQVEGSPLPSSILFGLNLLAVLTSKPGNFSTIDWESCKCRTLAGTLVQEYEYLCSQDIGLGNQLMTSDQSGDVKLPPTKLDLLKYDECGPSELIKENKSSEHHEFNIHGDRISVFEASKDSGSMPERQSSDLGDTLDVLSVIPRQGDENSAVDGTLEGKRDNTVCLHEIPEKDNEINLNQPVVLVLSAMAETGLVSLPSLLTAVLLQANNRSSAEQASAILPSNFEEVATGVLKARSDLKMEFFHLISFLLSHCMNKWRVPNDQNHFYFLATSLYSMLETKQFFGGERVPPYFTSDPELMPILAAALIAVCYGCDQNRSVVQQEISTDMLRSLIKSCKTSGLATSDSILLDGWGTNISSDNTQILLDTRNSLGDVSIRSSRKSARPVLGRGVSGVIRLSRNKGQRDGRGTRIGDDGPLKQRAGEASSNFMLHRKIPASFLDRAEEFFCSENNTAANITN